MGRSITMMAVLTTEKVIHAKQGNPMGFISFEDLSELVRCDQLPGRVSEERPSSGAMN